MNGINIPKPSALEQTVSSRAVEDAQRVQKAAEPLLWVANEIFRKLPKADGGVRVEELGHSTELAYDDAAAGQPFLCILPPGLAQRAVEAARDQLSRAAQARGYRGAKLAVEWHREDADVRVTEVRIELLTKMVGA
jgi:hypothetical protein